MNASLSRCGRFVVRQASVDTFKVRFTAFSHKNDIPVTFNVEGSVRGSNVSGTWQLQGSKRKLGKYIYL